MEQINYEALLTVQPLCGAADLAREAGRFPRGYLIYRSDPGRDTAAVSCSACGEVFRVKKLPSPACHSALSSAPFGWENPESGGAVISGHETICPACRGLLRTVHVSRMGRHNGELVDDALVTELLRLPAAGRRDRLAVVEWCVRQRVDKEARTRCEIWPYTAWVVEEKKLVGLTAFRKYMGGLSLTGRWKQRKTFRDSSYSGGVLAPWDPEMLEGATAENCKLELYIADGGKRLAGYLALWRKRPAVENLLVQGCGALVEKWIREEQERYGYNGGIPKLPAVNWKENRPARMLGLNREEFRQMRQSQWTGDDLKKYKQVRDSGVPVRLPEDMELLRGFPGWDLGEILSHSPGDFWRTLRYLQKQGHRSWTMLRDYWRMSAELDRDLTDSLVRWPRDLKAAHDRVMEEQTHRAEEALREAFRQRFAALSPLSLELGGLLIRPCRDQEELIAEGVALHHCVAGYARDHAGGKTAIFFIRRADRPQEPWFTLELDEKRLEVRQNRGLRNCDPSAEVRSFVAKWLNWCRKGAKQIA